MPPPRKAVLAVWIGLALFGVVIYAILRGSVLDSMLELERDQVRADVERVRLAISTSIARIGRSAADWGHWDDAYAFMAGRDERFVETNLVPVTYVTLGLDLIAFVGGDGSVVYAGYYDPARREIRQFPKTLSILLKPANPLLTDRSRAVRNGILMLRRCTLLVASRPILTSRAEGPPRGILIFGRVLDSDEIRSLAEVTRLNISIHRVDESPLPSGFRSALADIKPGNPVAVRPCRRGMIAGYALMDDIFGKPAVIIRVESDRGIYRQGKALVSYLLLALALAGLAFGGVVTALLWWMGRREVELEAHKRAFYRSTILAATDGKLIISDPRSIDEIAGPSIATWTLREPEDIGKVRSAIRPVAEAEGMDEDRIASFLACTGEAVTNAIKHAGGGTASLHRGVEWLMLVVSDKGPGIEATALPDVALRYGYTTAKSLGIGYKVMIELADKVYLATSATGTTVAVQMELREPANKPFPFPQLAEPNE
jgi:sensor domain CHASE-containing protein/anti-sigma regulatory factor (Ser/Thr protein kinase)